MFVRDYVPVLLCAVLVTGFARTEAADSYTFAAWGQETLTQIETNYRLTGSNNNLYAESLTQRFPGYAWPQGVMFSALIGAAKVDPSYLEKACSTADAFHNRYRCYYNGYWAYNAGAGGCGDRYYDDNAWIALGYMELYSLTGCGTYLSRAREILVFCMSGENGPGYAYDGGIRWHESNTGGVSICSTAPTCLANLMVYQATGLEQYLTDGARLYHWLAAASFLRNSSGIYHEINQGSLGYLTGVVLQSAVRLYRITGDTDYLAEAQRLASAMETQFINTTTFALGQTGKWGGHDMTNAYVDLYEVDGNPHWLNIATGYLTFLHEYCKDPASGRYPERWNDTSGSPSASLIDNASAARAFWKMASVPGGTVPVYPQLKHRTSGKCLWLLNSGTADNTAAVLYTDNSSWTTQMWELVDLGNGYYNIRSRHTPRSLQPQNALSADNTSAVVFATNAYSYAQQWKLIDVGSGYFNIQNRQTGKSLQPLNNGTVNSTAVVTVTTDLSRLSQHWQLAAAPAPTAITLLVSVNGGDWMPARQVIVDPGDTLSLKGSNTTGGSWSWFGPNGASATSLQVTQPDIRNWQAGRYSARYVNPAGVESYAAVDVAVSAGLRLHQHCDYAGWAASFGVGAYTQADLVAAGARNNDASSARIAPGYTVTFFADDNFQGARLVKTGDVSCLVSDGWNDRISSLIVEGGPQPAGYWPLNEQTGWTAYDDSGNGRHAGLVNMAPANRTVGKRCGGLTFDGTDDYLAVAGYTGVGGGQSRTCTAWVRTTGTQENLVLSWGSPQPGQKWMFGLVAGRVGAGTWGSSILTLRTVNDGRWHHIALVIPDVPTAVTDHIQLYIDGLPEPAVSVANNSIIDTWAVTDALIGTRKDGAAFGTSFDGRIDEIRVYDRPLSRTQIWNLYAADALTGDLVPDGVVDIRDFIGLADLWQTPGTTAADLSCDGLVDLTDFAILTEQWLQSL